MVSIEMPDTEDRLQRLGSGVAELTALVKCSICLGGFSSQVARTPCGHNFCWACLEAALKRTAKCPLCAAALTRRRLREDPLLGQIATHIARLASSLAALPCDPTPPAAGDHTACAAAVIAPASTGDRTAALQIIEPHERRTPAASHPTSPAKQLVSDVVVHVEPHLASQQTAAAASGKENAGSALPAASGDAAGQRGRRKRSRSEPNGKQPSGPARRSTRRSTRGSARKRALSCAPSASALDDPAPDSVECADAARLSSAEPAAEAETTRAASAAATSEQLGPVCELAGDPSPPRSSVDAAADGGAPGDEPGQPAVPDASAADVAASPQQSAQRSASELAVAGAHAGERARDGRPSDTFDAIFTQAVTQRQPLSGWQPGGAAAEPPPPPPVWAPLWVTGSQLVDEPAPAPPTQLLGSGPPPTDAIPCDQLHCGPPQPSQQADEDAMLLASPPDATASRKRRARSSSLQRSAVAPEAADEPLKVAAGSPTPGQGRPTAGGEEPTAWLERTPAAERTIARKPGAETSTAEGEVRARGGSTGGRPKSRKRAARGDATAPRRSCARHRDWPCSACTFLNRAANKKCEMCGTAHADGAATPASPPPPGSTSPADTAVRLRETPTLQVLSAETLSAETTGAPAKHPQRSESCGRGGALRTCGAAERGINGATPHLLVDGPCGHSPSSTPGLGRTDARPKAPVLETPARGPPTSSTGRRDEARPAAAESAVDTCTESFSTPRGVLESAGGPPERVTTLSNSAPTGSALPANVVSTERPEAPPAGAGAANACTASRVQRVAAEVAPPAIGDTQAEVFETCSEGHDAFGALGVIASASHAADPGAGPTPGKVAPAAVAAPTPSALCADAATAADHDLRAAPLPLQQIPPADAVASAASEETQLSPGAPPPGSATTAVFDASGGSGAPKAAAAGGVTPGGVADASGGPSAAAAPQSTAAFGVLPSSMGGPHASEGGAQGDCDSLGCRGNDAATGSLRPADGQMATAAGDEGGAVDDSEGPAQKTVARRPRQEAAAPRQSRTRQSAPAPGKRKTAPLPSRQGASKKRASVPAALPGAAGADLRTLMKPAPVSAPRLSAHATRRSGRKGLGLVTSALTQEQADSVRALERLAKGARVAARVEAAVSQNTTHLVCGCTGEGAFKRTAKYYQAVAKGLWVVSMDWVVASLCEGRVVAEQGFVIGGDGGAAARSRAAADDAAPRLLDGFVALLLGSFEFSATGRAVMEDLLASSGARLARSEAELAALTRDGGARVCVCDLDTNAADVLRSGSEDPASLREIGEQLGAPVVSFRWLTASLDAWAVADVTLAGPYNVIGVVST